MSGGAAELPGPAPRVAQALAESAAHPATNEEERLEAAVRLWAALAGSGDPVDLARLRAREIRMRARARNIAAAQNHGLAVANSTDRMDALRTVKGPRWSSMGPTIPSCPSSTARRPPRAFPARPSS
jgi:hypothetical protein